jgi:uncharacterized membrane protein
MPTMLPDPLHPAVVHFPIVLAVLMPAIGLAAAWAIHAGRLRAVAWVAVVAVQLMLVGSGWLAAETGEHEEERVERVIAESPIEAHEEAAERFLILAALTLPLAAVGMLARPFGAAARGLTVAASLGVAAAVVGVGHSGGELVYEHGAAQAYTQPAASAPGPGWTDRDDDHDDDD